MKNVFFYFDLKRTLWVKGNFYLSFSVCIEEGAGGGSDTGCWGSPSSSFFPESPEELEGRQLSAVSSTGPPNLSQGFFL